MTAASWLPDSNHIAELTMAQIESVTELKPKPLRN